MSNYKYAKIIFILSIAGVLFSGYLSAVKLITLTCALNEPCPYFLGYPACWYGFGMFFVLFVSALMGFSEKFSLKKIAVIQALVSFLGIVFATYFTIPEIGLLLSGASRYALGLPTCAYGLIFYAIIFAVSVRYLITYKD